MTGAELLAALTRLPFEALAMEVEVELDVTYPSGEEGAEDWIVSPTIDRLVFHDKPGDRRYVYLEVSG